MKKRLFLPLVVSLFIIAASPTLAREAKTALSTVTQKLTIAPDGQANISGTVVGKNGNVLTLKSWGGDWNITTDSATRVKSKFDAPLSLNDLLQGNMLSVQGSIRPDRSWTIDADTIKNESNEMNEMSVIGTITSLSGASAQLETKSYGTLTVRFTTDTKILLKKNTFGNPADLKNGMRVIVHGTAGADPSVMTALDIQVKSQLDPQVLLKSIKTLR